MIVSTYLSTIRSMLRDEAAVSVRKWSDTTLVTYASLTERGLIQTLANAHEQYQNARVVLRAADAIQRHDGIFEHELLPWLYRITEDGVREVRSSTESQGPVVPMLRHPGSHVRRNGVRIENSNALWDYSGSARDLEVRCVRLPAAAIAGAVDTDATDDTSLVLVDDALATYSHDVVRDAYAGMTIRCTGIAAGVTTAEAANVGEQRVCSSSRVEQVSAESYRLVLRFDRRWPVTMKVGHQYESMLAIKPPHQEYFLEEVRLQAFVDRDMPVSETMNTRLRAVRARFLEGLTREDSAARHYGSEPTFVSRDPDHDPWLDSQA